MSDVVHPSPEQIDEINSGIRYAMYSVFRVSSPWTATGTRSPVRSPSCWPS